MSFLSAHAISLLLLVFIALGVISHNSSITIASAILLIVLHTPLVQYAPIMEKYGLHLGIIILTIAVLSPLVSGKIQAEDMMQVFTHWKTMVAVIVGVLVAWLGGRGVTLMVDQPTVVTGLLVGTIIGVTFFRGVPVGPLIAAGIVSVLLWTK